MASIKLNRVEKKQKYTKREVDRLIDQINAILAQVEAKLNEVSQ